MLQAWALTLVSEDTRQEVGRDEDRRQGGGRITKLHHHRPPCYTGVVAESTLHDGLTFGKPGCGLWKARERRGFPGTLVVGGLGVPLTATTDRRAREPGRRRTCCLARFVAYYGSRLS